MAEQVEISGLDLRYESCRLRSKPAEKRLLDSIITHGIRDPLQGVDTGDGAKILLDGFKRFRCAKKLGIGIVPWYSFGNDESVGILELLRISNSKSLAILEQARLIDELQSIHGMCGSDIALLLERSRAWVSVRAGIIKEMSKCVMDKIFSGRFPAYFYMYTLRRFMRINSVSKKDVDEFVTSVAGRNLSLRDIDILANGYFKGSDEIRDQIRNGNISWGPERLRTSFANAGACTQAEQKMLKSLEIAQKYMQRISCKSHDTRLKTASFRAQANLLAGGILRQIQVFEKAVRGLHDRCG
ncbi:MAG: ParB N-terminal domain-containing protein [Dissulfuribacterales bacterium]